MKIIVTHDSPDMDAITSVWLIRKYLPGWENAQVNFVPAGERLQRLVNERLASSSEEQLNAKRYTLYAIERIGEDEVIHVDTGMGPLDHHQTSSDQVCAASLTFDFVKRIENSTRFAKASARRELKVENSEKQKSKMEALERMVKVIVDIDHFKEVFRKDPLADYHEFDLASILDGLKFQFPNQNDYYIEFVSKALDAILHAFENRIWAEREIEKNGKKFNTRFGKGIGFETINDSVIKLAQKMKYAIVLRKDPRKGYVRIKAVPSDGKTNINLTLAYEKLCKMDPQATWFLHVSKKMLLNGSIKNPKMRPTKLTIEEIIGVLEGI